MQAWCAGRPAGPAWVIGQMFNGPVKGIKKDIEIKFWNWFLVLGKLVQDNPVVERLGKILRKL
jgi:hypothetical protein